MLASCADVLRGSSRVPAPRTVRGARTRDEPLRTSAWEATQMLHVGMLRGRLHKDYTNAKHNRIKCLPLVNPKATTDCPAILPKLNWGYFLTLPKRAFSNQHSFVDLVMLVSARTVRLQQIATSLNRQIVQDIPSLTP